MKKSLLIFILLSLSSSVFAKEGSIGISLDVSVSGFFSPDLSEVTVNDVSPNEPAEKAGIKKGELITAIEGCAIPGCPASKAKKLMAKKAGETLTFMIKNPESNEEREVIVHVE